MINKNVCPNCGQLYDPELAKCPLCGQAPQVVETEKPVQRRRITEAERRQRRAERKDAELEARRRRKDEQMARDAEEERLLEEEEAQRREERRRAKEEKKALRQKQRQAEAENAVNTEPAPAPTESAAEEPAPQSPIRIRMGRSPAAESEPAPAPIPTPVVTPAPVRTKQRPERQEKTAIHDRGRVPRVFLVLCTVLLAATLIVGGSYLLWKLGTVKLPIYDRLAEKKQTSEPAAENSDTAQNPTVPTQAKCLELTVNMGSYEFTREGDTVFLKARTEPVGLVESYTSSDESVAVVGESGLITAVGPGKAVITVTCGDKQVECAVICRWEEPETTLPPDLPEGDLELENPDMSFFAKGESYVQTVVGLAPGTPVIWSSADESVATVDAGGHITAVGPGTTTVTATVGNSSASCWVRCTFNAEEDDNGGE